MYRHIDCREAFIQRAASIEMKPAVYCRCWRRKTRGSVASSVFSIRKKSRTPSTKEAKQPKPAPDKKVVRQENTHSHIEKPDAMKVQLPFRRPERIQPLLAAKRRANSQNPEDTEHRKAAKNLKHGAHPKYTATQTITIRLKSYIFGIHRYFHGLGLLRSPWRIRLSPSNISWVIRVGNLESYTR